MSGPATRRQPAAVPRRRWLARPVIVCTVFAVTLLLLEVAAAALLRHLPPPATTFAFSDVWAHGRNPFHQVDDELFWALRPGYHDRVVSIGANGFRGPDVAMAKPPRTFRIVVMGDSVTFGYGVSEPSTFVRRLEQRMNEPAARLALGAPARVEVVNAGVVGYTSWQGRQSWPRRIAALDPDLVLLGYGYNDHHSAEVSDAVKSARGRQRRIRDWFGRTAAASVVRRLVSDGTARSAVPRVSVDEFAANIAALCDAARARGAGCATLTVPLRPTLPLVENFIPVDYLENGQRRRIWMRQIDLAARLLGARAGVVTRHFADAAAGLDAFVGDRESCAVAHTLATQYDRLPIFWYLSWRCATAAGETTLAEQARVRIEANDQGRRDLGAYAERLTRLAQHDGIPRIDLTGRLASGDLFLDVVHPNAAGHDKIAEVIAEALRHGLGNRPH